MRRRRNPELPLPPEVLVLVDALDELGLVSPEFIQCMLVYNEEERLATVDRWMTWLEDPEDAQAYGARSEHHHNASVIAKWLKRNQGTWDDAREVVREKTKFSGLGKFSTRVCSILYDWWMEGSDEDFFFGEGNGSAGAFTSNPFIDRSDGSSGFPFFFAWFRVAEDHPGAISIDKAIPDVVYDARSFRVPDNRRRAMNSEDWESILGIKAFIIEEHDSGAVYCEGYDDDRAFGQALEVLRARQGEGEEPEPDEGPDTPQEDDLFTSNYRTFFSSGRRVLTVDENGQWQARVREHMRRENYYPNVWLSDPRGGNTLLDAYPIDRELDQTIIKLALREKRLFIMTLGPDNRWTGAKLSSYRDAQARMEQVGMGEDMFIVIIDEPWLNESAARQREEAGYITALAVARRVELGIITQTGPAVGVVAVRRNDG